MKIILMGFMALLLVAGGAAGGYFYVQNTAVASGGVMDEHAKAAKMAKEQAYVDAKKAAENIRFVELDPIILPIIDTQGVTQVVTLVVSLEVYGEDNADFAKRMSPRLKDAFIQDMYGVLNRKASMEGGVVRADQLKARLLKASGKVLGTQRVNDVLLQVVSQRPV